MPLAPEVQISKEVIAFNVLNTVWAVEIEHKVNKQPIIHFLPLKTLSWLITRESAIHVLVRQAQDSTSFMIPRWEGV